MVFALLFLPPNARKLLPINRDQCPTTTNDTTTRIASASLPYGHSITNKNTHQLIKSKLYGRHANASITKQMHDKNRNIRSRIRDNIINKNMPIRGKKQELNQLNKKEDNKMQNKISRQIALHVMKMEIKAELD